MQLLALFYAFLAGLAGLVPAHGVARADAVLGRSVTEGASVGLAVGQASASARALALRTAIARIAPIGQPVDGRRDAVAIRSLPMPFAGRLVPERRRE